METVTLIISDAPYGVEKPWNALRLAQALVATKQKVNIFLLGDGVALAKKGQQTPAGYYNLSQMLGELVVLGAQVRACGTCINSRGIKKDELVEGVEVGKMLDLARWIEASAKVVTF
ncbi:MAG: DsrE family protein [Acidobacteriota bacterium]